MGHGLHVGVSHTRGVRRLAAMTTPNPDTERHPLLDESPLPYGLPDFATVRDEDLEPAILTAIDDHAAEIAATGRDEVLARWRLARGELADALTSADPGEKIPWFGPPMRPGSMITARIMESWAHGIDVADGLGSPVNDDPAFVAALPHVAKLGFKTRAFAYMMNGLEAPTSEIHVALTHPDGTAVEFGTAGADQRVSGPLLDFCLLVTQRVHLDDTDLETLGDDAAEWLRIAQAFAGLPGGGREKGTRS